MSTRDHDEAAEDAAWRPFCDKLDKRFTDDISLEVIDEARKEIADIAERITGEQSGKPCRILAKDWYALKAYVGGLHLANEMTRDIMRQMATDLAELRQELGRRKAMIYRGVHVTGEVYDVGDMVTYAGGIWHCNEITEARPGDGNPAWTLAVKKGRDAKGVTRATA